MISLSGLLIYGKKEKEKSSQEHRPWRRTYFQAINPPIFVYRNENEAFTFLPRPIF